VNDLFQILVVKVFRLDIAVRGDRPRGRSDDNFMRAEKVLVYLIKEGLATCLDADRQCHLGVHQLLLERGLDDPDVTFPQLFVLGRGDC
jgi:hypothetical protein